MEIEPVSDECVCKNDTMHNSVMIMELVSDVTVLKQEISFLNHSLRSLEQSRITVDVFDGLNETVSAMKTAITTLNQSLTALQQSKRANDVFADLNQTVIGVTITLSILNQSVAALLLETVALEASFSSLNDSQLVSSSMYPGWPDAITCNRTNIGPTIHYLVIAAEMNDPSYWYRWVGWESYDKTSNYIFYPNGSYKNHVGGATETSNCDGKSIHELYDEGVAFDFIAV